MMSSSPNTDEPAPATVFPHQLDGEAFRLRPATIDDVPDVVAACSDPTVSEHVPRMPRPYTVADAREFILTSTIDNRRSGHPQWVIADVDTDRYLGSIGVTRNQPDRDTAEIGYLVAPWARGRRLAARALTT